MSWRDLYFAQPHPDYGCNTRSFERRTRSSQAHEHHKQLPNCFETFLSGCSPSQRAEVYDHLRLAGAEAALKLLEEIGDE